MIQSRRDYARLVFFCACLFGLGGCQGAGTTLRLAGQVELFEIEPETHRLARPLSPNESLPLSRKREDLTQNWGSNIRFNTDVVTVQVHSLCLEDVPKGLTGSRDIVVFADVWENAAAAYGSPPLTSIAYLGKNQLVPGRMNFSGAIVYGPTLYKGTPLKVRFTVMLLQKEKGSQQAEIADVIAKYTSLIPTYGAIASEIVGVIRDMLRAQPDIITFDYEAVLIADEPNRTEAASSVSSERNGIDKQASAWNSWDLRTGWLRYSYYSLVETAARAGSSEADSGRYSRDHNYVMDGGWLYKLDKKDTPSSDRLRNSYLVFSITPRQLELTDEFMRAASEANATLLSSLRQTDSNIQSTLTTVKQESARLQARIVRARLENEGRRIATMKDQTASVFSSRFNERAAQIKEELRTGSAYDNASEFEAIRSAVHDRFFSDLSSLKVPVDPASDLGKARQLAQQSRTDVTRADALRNAVGTSATRLSPLLEGCTTGRRTLAETLRSASGSSLGSSRTKMNAAVGALSLPNNARPAAEKIRLAETAVSEFRQSVDQLRGAIDAAKACVVKGPTLDALRSAYEPFEVELSSLESVIAQAEKAAIESEVKAQLARSQANSDFSALSSATPAAERESILQRAAASEDALLAATRLITEIRQFRESVSRLVELRDQAKAGVELGDLVDTAETTHTEAAALLKDKEEILRRFQ